ncbi:uncharacterized protein LOC133194553 [Saccostrea echinata]|uniref:uncharacterized protein LOC133194553 n=1 Tax=Saccostrea echinata TaxID=191078 RepID=UPI002A7FD34A|nr:uncharacterized protein LOC133194553 [Saccostrea echinata]
MTSLLEVCAPSTFILSGKCTEFNKECQCIRKSYFADCSQFSTPCPDDYNSTTSFLYSQCHKMISTTTDKMPDATIKDMQTTEQQPKGVIDSPITLTIIVITLSITLIIIILISFFIIRRKKGMGSCYDALSPRRSNVDQRASSRPLSGDEPMLMKEH